jgi:hypothetical protein
MPSRRDALLSGAAFLTAPGLAGAASRPDRAIAFGYKSTWFAIHSRSAPDVLHELDLVSARRATWADGMRTLESDYDAQDGLRAVFVAPAVGAWTFAIGWGLLRGERGREDPDRFMVPLRRLLRLSRRFGEAQFFSTHRVVEAHAWARARGATIERAYGYVGDRGTEAVNIGRPTEAERGVVGSEANEETVMRIAGAWSLDPTKIGGRPTTGPGFIGLRPGDL